MFEEVIAYSLLHFWWICGEVLGCTWLILIGFRVYLLTISHWAPDIRCSLCDCCQTCIIGNAMMFSMHVSGTFVWVYSDIVAIGLRSLYCNCQFKMTLLRWIYMLYVAWAFAYPLDGQFWIIGAKQFCLSPLVMCAQKLHKCCSQITVLDQPGVAVWMKLPTSSLPMGMSWINGSYRLTKLMEGRTRIQSLCSVGVCMKGNLLCSLGEEVAAKRHQLRNWWENLLNHL